MVLLSPAPPVLDPRIITPYYNKDLLVGNLPVVVFHGASTTTNSTRNSSRIQAHIYSIAGFQSFPRLTIAPTSPLYAAVHHLPEEKQGDEVYRGLAVSLLKYFLEMSELTKTCLTNLVALGCQDQSLPAMFDEKHAAKLASGMVRVENKADVIEHISTALAEKHLSWIDVDIVLPSGSFTKTTTSASSNESEENPALADDGRPLIDYGEFNEIVKLFGSPSFLPTSKLRRAPSRPTVVGRNRTLAQHQRESLQREVKELVETEKSYVLKLHDLEKSVAVRYTRSTNSKPFTGMQSDDSKMRELFPESLSQILDMNTEFLDEISLVSENELDSRGVPVSHRDGLQASERDSTGVEAFAKLLLRYFPRFKDPYQDYLKASARFPTILNHILRNGPSKYTEALYLTGEQRLKSLLIEPVQRLPRYSLFIDNMVNQLPSAHPAVGKFLKAKDVITDICALDQDESLDNNRLITHLRKLVAKWPESLAPLGRLITAVDATELKAPYAVPPSMEDTVQCILLLFPDYVVVLKKLNEHALSARGLLAEIDRVSLTVSTAPQTLLPPQSLSLIYAFRLQETRFTESNNGSLISLFCIRETSHDSSHSGGNINYAIVTRVYCLLGAYEGKAARWNEEAARAKIEYRFPEKIRETERWSLRTTNPQVNGLGIVSAIFEDDSNSDETLQRRLYGHVQILVQRQDERDENDLWKVQFPTVEITARIVTLESNIYLLEFAAFGDTHSTDEVHGDDLWTIFSRRLSDLQRLQSQPLTPKIAQANISFAQKVVESVRPKFVTEEIRPRNRFRPVSPVKALSGLLTGSLRDQTAPVKQLDTDNPEAFSYSLSDALGSDIRLGKPDIAGNLDSDPLKSKVILINSIDQHPNGSLSQLESTLHTYIVALHSRNGNIVGKVLRGRSGADELRVNELYNTLIEDSTLHQAAAEVSVDVLFCSFEKFLSREWKDRMGPIVTSSLLEKMQSLFGKPQTVHTAGHFKSLLTEMSPQNRRAFSSIIKLLSDLLDASGNDGDRGALTASFAEALVSDGDPHMYIPLLDCLVEDLDTFFEDIVLVGPMEPGTTGVTIGSLQRTRSVNTGSLSSNGSSLRKRFGFGTLTRENSKSDSESRVGQMWRSLSKKASGDGDTQPASISRSILSRSRSTDNDSRKPFAMGPDFKDHISLPNSRQGESRSRPGSAHNIVPNLITIGEAELQSLQHPSKKKRRSSLSDLHTLQRVNSPVLEIQSQKPKPALQRANVPLLQSVRETTKDSSPPRLRSISPSRSPSKLPSPINRRENVRPQGIHAQPGKSGKPSLHEPTIPPRNQSRHELARSRIPSLRHGLQERPDASNSPSPLPRKPTSSPQKMRIQSPQKLRERLEKEKQAIQDAEPALRTELTKIGEEIALLKSPSKISSNSVTDYSRHINTVENKVSHALGGLAKQNRSIQTDLESTLIVSEKKIRSLDELYREANAENELLYERFNTELLKVLKSVKSGEGVEEMRSRLKESQNDAARLRKENQRLKRENLGLKSQLKEA